MPIRDLIAPLDGSACDEAALAAAEAIAGPNGGRVAAVLFGVLPLYTSAAVAGDYGSVLAGLDQRALEEIGEAETRARARLPGLGIPHEFRRVDAGIDEAARVMAHHARYADLAVFGWAPGDPGHRIRRALLEAALLGSGRPVLAVPGRAPARIGSRAVVAWNARREAARAVHDALPLLEGAEAVRVVVVDGSEGYDGHGRDPGVDVATHLARHLPAVEVRHVPSGGRPVAAVLLDEARYLGADLLVAGGYGHARAREWLFGGVTRDLLETADVPVLMSH